MKPNIVLINCDDLGYGDLHCYGSKVNDTPAIDGLCARGLKLTDFYMASPVCSPSRGGMLTGCYPPRIDFGDFDGRTVLFPGQGIGLSRDEKTIAKMLKEQDYKTMIIGKWHCGDQPEFLPQNYGFDAYYGLPYSNDMGIQVGPPTGYPPLPLMADDQVIEQQPDQASLTERYVEQAVRFMRANKSAPFFLYLAHMHVHLPHYAGARFLKESRNGEYGASVAEIDWSVAAIMDELRSLGLEKDTLVIFTSDNGSNLRYGGSNGPLRGEKTQTWEGGQRVPCIWHWPGHIEAGESDELVSSIDFYRTLAAVAGGSAPEKPIDSLDVSDVIFGRNGGHSPRETFYYYYVNNLEAVRAGDWKLHVWKAGQAVCQLYNLREDLCETTDLAAEHPEIVERLQAFANACREDIGDAATGISGKNVRSAERVEHPKPLTEYSETHPYIIAAYDKPDRG